MVPGKKRPVQPINYPTVPRDAPFAEITFDFVLHRERVDAPNTVVPRAHAEAA
jgi:hypothetical protein